MLYLDKINQYIKGLDHESLLMLEKISGERLYKKGDLLLRAGEICTRSFLVLSGIARKYYLDDGKEYTTEIFFEGDLAVSFQSYTLQQPGREFMEALTDVRVSVTDHHAFQQAKAAHPPLVTLDLMLAEYYAMWLEERMFQFHTRSASQRYADLLERTPEIIQKVPLTIIASYLGISLETLSRIRARL